MKTLKFLNSVTVIIFIMILISGCSAGSSSVKTPSITDQVASAMGITNSQAEAGLGAMLMLSRNKLSPEDFANLSKNFPGGGINLINKATSLGVNPGSIGTTLDVENVLTRLGTGMVTASKFVPTVLNITSNLGGNTFTLLSKVF
ncbi:MAG: DUF2780 domain-containing protein [Ignavibacteria bacterium]|nr:DUF2780 domain-containing protein [Ignavibacteria bacterium]